MVIRHAPIPRKGSENQQQQQQHVNLDIRFVLFLHPKEVEEYTTTFFQVFLNAGISRRLFEIEQSSEVHSSNNSNLEFVRKSINQYFVTINAKIMICPDQEISTL